jgi:predicted helicase
MLCFVSNNSFIDQVAFDGVRKHLAKDFDRIFVIDLKGNIRKDSMRDGIPLGENHTVFGLAAMVGVSVSMFIRLPTRARKKSIKYADVPFRSTRTEKFEFLSNASTLFGIKWRHIIPDDLNTWLHLPSTEAFRSFVRLGHRPSKGSETTDIRSITTAYSGGVKTHRDEVVYHFERNELKARVSKFIERYNAEVDRYKRLEKPVPIDDFVDYSKIKWSRDLKNDVIRGRYAKFHPTKIRNALYRPFRRRLVFFDSIVNEEVYSLPSIFPSDRNEHENVAICATGVGAEKPFATMITSAIPDMNFFGPGTVPQWFPFYEFDEKGTNRRENITDWALQHFREHYNDKKITKWDIFYYVYGILHHPGYRTKFADNLKRELPRIPLAPDFKAFAKAGQKLADLHLNYEQLEPWPLKWIETEDVPLSYRVEKMRLSKDKTQLKVNESLTLAKIPPEVFNYRLGNRSALDWVIDQYQVSTDKRSGITSDPNNPDDEEYIVRLVGQVVRVSVETVKIVNSLPKQFAPSERPAKSAVKG